MEKRKYTQVRRAEQQDDTRRRIVEATMALHEEIGPRRTTISAIAERAGVQRLTVYRHFPDEAAVIHACSSTWFGQNPPPPLPAEGSGGTVDEALRDALQALYAYHRRTRRMWDAVLRDAGEVEALREPLAQAAAYFASYGDALLRKLHPRGEPGREARAAVALAVNFATWSTLADAGLADKAIARLMADWLGVACAR
ncbi:TetR/AcrR family transcriptional regulator [Caenimonas aquaedulcis]|nr:TetR/AcrR family transcriptional regulator [Caenimonas aquaedulcis]